MIDDWTHKEHTVLNMFSVSGEQIRSLSSKQSKLNFWNRLHQKIAFLRRLLTQTATWRPNHIIFSSSVKAILKAMTDTDFLGPSLGVVRIFLFTVGGFFQQERVLWGWLPGPSRTMNQKWSTGRNLHWILLHLLCLQSFRSCSLGVWLSAAYLIHYLKHIAKRLKGTFCN